MQRALAMVERELRRFRRSPALIVMALVTPLIQLIVLGYAFGGQVKHLTVGVVDQDGGMPAVRLRELAGAVGANAQTFSTKPYTDMGQALEALRNGHLNGVLAIPPDFSRRKFGERNPRVALIEDNTDNFVAATLAGSMHGVVQASNAAPATSVRMRSETVLDQVELYPYVPYIQYLLSGSIVLSIYMMVMIGGGIIFVDDKARGLHEGYLVTPITRLELILGFNISGAIKAVLAGLVLMTVGLVIAGVPNPFDLLRLGRVFVVIVFTAIALVSLMFLLVVRVNDPLLPRATFGVLNTVLYFPSGAVYPQQAFPWWMRMFAKIDPFTYAVHALKSLLLKNTGFAAIWGDLLFLALFTVVTMTAATLLFRRTI
ncbi:MAG: ABC transporter permease [Gemmatimonadota bacterium]